MQKKVDVSEFICKLILQLKIDKSAWCIYVTLPPFFPEPYSWYLKQIRSM